MFTRNKSAIIATISIGVLFALTLLVEKFVDISDISLIAAMLAMTTILVITQRAIQDKKRSNEYMRLRKKIEYNEKVTRALRASVDNRTKELSARLVARISVLETQPHQEFLSLDNRRSQKSKTPSLRTVLNSSSRSLSDATAGRAAAQVEPDQHRNTVLNRYLSREIKNTLPIFRVSSNRFRVFSADYFRDYKLVDLQPHSDLDENLLTVNTRMIITSDAFIQGTWSSADSTSGLAVFADLQDHVNRIRDKGGLVYFVNLGERKDVLTEEICKISDVVVNDSLFIDTDWISQAPIELTTFLQSFKSFHNERENS